MEYFIFMYVSLSMPTFTDDNKKSVTENLQNEDDLKRFSLASHSLRKTNIIIVWNADM